MTRYPGALDDFPNLTEPQLQSGNLANAVANLNDAIEAMEATLGVEPGKRFHKTVTLTSAAAATPVEIIPDADVPAGRKVYLEGYIAKVDGGTDWATVTTVTIRDKNGTPVAFVTLTASALDGNEVHGPWSDSATLEDAFSEGTGGTAAKGLEVVGDQNGTGSDLKLTVWGIIR